METKNKKTQKISALILTALIFAVSGELIVNDLTLEGGHSYCLYNQTGGYQECYTGNIHNIPSNTNYTLYVQSKGLDSLLSMDTTITSLYSILPLIIFIVFGIMILLGCLISVYLYMRG